MKKDRWSVGEGVKGEMELWNDGRMKNMKNRVMECWGR
jgi:hypothetical protein